MVDTLVKRYGTQVAVRVTTPLMPISYDLKAWIIYVLGGYAWRQLCDQQQIMHHDKFGGVYDFNASLNRLATLWQDWLQRCPIQPVQSTSDGDALHSMQAQILAKSTLIMCHPAIPVGSGDPCIAPWDDEIKSARECEYQWLMSDDFAQLCQQQQVQLTKWSI